jgi:hypothetical protein
MASTWLGGFTSSAAMSVGTWAWRSIVRTHAG